jgi:OHCU decarboxylase
VSALEEWNRLDAAEAQTSLLACCGSRAFASAVVASRPYPNLDALLAKADAIWWSLPEADWREAFACHPRIGESHANASARFSAWSSQEQSTARAAAEPVLDAIARRNREYEARHGFIYIVCANGRTAEELLAVLDSRLENPTGAELREAAEQQRQITHIRMRKLFTL